MARTARKNYYNALASSDKENIVAFDTDFNSIKTKESYSTYPATRRVSPSLPLFCNPSTPPSSTTVTSKRSFCRHRGQKLSSARRTVVQVLSGPMKNLLSSTSTYISCSSTLSSTDHTDCCTDSGATDDMMTTYRSFLSYIPVCEKYTILGDNTLVEIKGFGTAVYKLNGKFIKIWNALHIPALRGPLSTMRKHCRQKECGIFA